MYWCVYVSTLWQKIRIFNHSADRLNVSKKSTFKKACQKIGLKLRILEKKEAFLKQLKKGLPDEIIRKNIFSPG